MSRYVTTVEYAKLCKVTLSAIWLRIDKGTLELTDLPLPDGSMGKYVDTEKYPPGRIKTGRPAGRKDSQARRTTKKK